MNEPRFPSLQRLRAAHAALLKTVDDSDELTDAQLDQVLDFLDQGSRTGQILHDVDSRADAQSLLNYWTTVLTANGHRFRPVLLDSYDVREVAAEQAQRPPYPGLNAFEREDSFLFFGREPLIRQMVERLRSGTRLLAVVGLSGSGKSSLVRAGLVPVLEQGGVEGSEQWVYPPPVIPGSHPLLALREALREVAADKTALVVLDQFEEVFTASETQGERQEFLDEVVKLATVAVPVRYLVLTMRSEYDTYVEQHAGLKELFLAGKIQVAPLTETDLRKAIEGPAAQRGVTFDPGLSRELARQVLGQPAGLPLLQFTLSKLWETASEGRIRAEAYSALGGDPREILRKSADATYERLGEDKELTRRLFQELVDFRGGTEMVRRRRTRKYLRDFGSRDRVDTLLEKWQEAGLLRIVKGRTADEDMVDLSHETLIRNWQQLIDWANELREVRRRRLLLRARTAEWKERDEKSSTVGSFLIKEAIPRSPLDLLSALSPAGALDIGMALWDAIRKGRVRWRDAADEYLTAGQLEEAEKYTDLTEEEREYVARSREVVFAGQRLLSRVLTGLIAMGFVLVGASAWLTIRTGVEIGKREAAVRKYEQEQRDRQSLIDQAVRESERKLAESEKRLALIQAQIESRNKQLQGKVTALEAEVKQERQTAAASKETLARVATIRPAFQVGDNGIEFQQTKEWAALRANTREILRNATAVGRLQPSDSRAAVPYYGTAFLVGDGIIVSASYITGSQQPTTTGMMIDFGNAPGKESGSVFRVGPEVGRVPPKGTQQGLVFHAIQAGNRQLPRPIRIARTARMSTGVPVYLISYPAKDARADPVVLEATLGNQFGVKRLQPGYILSDSTSSGLLCDAFSSGGSGGAPVIDAESHLVISLHYARRQSGQGLGVGYSRPFQDPEVVRELNRLGIRLW